MHNDLKKPCNACPFRKTSLPGYVGDSTPEQFIETTMSDQPMPCHITVDYEDPFWEETYEDDASYCRGALNLFANSCKLSRDRTRPQGTKDPEVFKNSLEFLEHHRKGPRHAG